MKFLVITLSTRASQGVYEDSSGKKIISMLQSEYPNESFEYKLIPDRQNELEGLLSKATNSFIDFIFTTGGTGIGASDITIEVTEGFITKKIPGIMEFIRLKYGQKNRNALLSRSICGLCKKSVIFCLPGGYKAVKEYMSEILPVLDHMFDMKENIDSHGKI